MKTPRDYQSVFAIDSSAITQSRRGDRYVKEKANRGPDEGPLCNVARKPYS